MGHEEEINGLSTYISQPEDGSKSKSIIIISDSMHQPVPYAEHQLTMDAFCSFWIQV